MAVVVQIPDDVEQQLRREFPELERNIIEGFVCEAFRRGELSSFQVGQILGLESRWDAMSFLSDRGVYPGSDIEELEEGRRTFRKLATEAGE